MTHNKNLIHLLYLLINCISTRSTSKLLPIKDEYTSRFSNFLIIGLSSSSDNCWFDIISLLIAPPEVLAALSTHVAAFSSENF